jgi:hypothetical protein
MTEADWLSCTDPSPMLQYLWGRAGDRPLYPFAVALLRPVWKALKSPRSRRAVEMAEKYADRQVSWKEFAQAHVGADLAAELPRRADIAKMDPTKLALLREAQPFHEAAALATAAHIRENIRECAQLVSGTDTTVLAFQAATLRDIIGNPFRPVAVDPAWLTPNVGALATTIYEDRAFDRMPILADALEEAGCDNDDILAHCRGPGAHVRGCWILDLVLVKR